MIGSGHAQSRDEATARLHSVRRLLHNHGVKRLSIFGSVGRDEATSQSDIDLIVDYFVKPDLLEFIALQHALSDALGIPVDLTTQDSLRPELKSDILAEAIDAEATGWIGTVLERYDLAKLRKDRKTIDAVLRNFEILGEASARVPPDMQAFVPDIDWRGIRDFRNVIAHFYRGVDLELVWDLFQNRLPPLRAALDRLTQRMGL